MEYSFLEQKSLEPLTLKNCQGLTVGYHEKATVFRPSPQLSWAAILGPLQTLHREDLGKMPSRLWQREGKSNHFEMFPEQLTRKPYFPGSDYLILALSHLREGHLSLSSSPSPTTPSLPISPKGVKGRNSLGENTCEGHSPELQAH